MRKYPACGTALGPPAAHPARILRGQGEQSTAEKAVLEEITQIPARILKGARGGNAGKSRVDLNAVHSYGCLALVSGECVFCVRRDEAIERMSSTARQADDVSLLHASPDGKIVLLISEGTFCCGFSDCRGS